MDRPLRPIGKQVIRDLAGQVPHRTAPSWRDNALVVMAGLAVALIFYLRCQPWDLKHYAMIGAPFGRDFVNFWIGGRLALDGGTAIFVDLPRYNALIATQFGHVPDAFIFSYPPHVLLVLAPLALLPYPVALGLWTGLNLAGLAAATRRIAPDCWVAMAILTCLSPAVLMMVLYGHFGGLMAAAVTVVVLDGERRPVQAGLCLAALSVKPQIALGLGLILLASGYWRCLCVSAVTALALAVASAAIFGADAWIRFVDFTLPAQSRLMAHGDDAMLATTISTFSAARLIHLPDGLAWTLQAGVSLGAMGTAIMAMRDAGAGVPRTMTVVPLAVLVALPYVNHYDLAIAAPALTVRLMNPKARHDGKVFGLMAWLVPPLSWHLYSLTIPLVAPVIVAAMAAPSRVRWPFRAIPGLGRSKGDAGVG